MRRAIVDFFKQRPSGRINAAFAIRIRSYVGFPRSLSILPLEATYRWRSKMRSALTRKAPGGGRAADGHLENDTGPRSGLTLVPAWTAGAAPAAALRRRTRLPRSQHQPVAAAVLGLPLRKHLVRAQRLPRHHQTSRHRAEFPRPVVRSLSLRVRAAAAEGRGSSGGARSVSDATPGVTEVQAV